MDDYYVYEHRLLSNGSTFYVGKGRGRRAWNKNRRNKDWFAIASEGFTVHFIQENMKEDDALLLECEIIANYGLCNLANRTFGGEGKGSFPPEVRKIMSEKAKGRTGFWKGKKRYPETILKMSKAMKGENHPRWGMKGDSCPSYGRKHSDETKRKMSKAQKGKIVTEEARKNLSLAKSGEGHHMFDGTTYVFLHASGSTYEGSQFAFRNKFGLQQSAVRRLVRGERKSLLHGWKMASALEPDLEPHPAR